MEHIAAVFPGQGSQVVGMGKDLLSQFPKTRLVFEEAEDSTHLQIRELCFNGPAVELEKTAHQQPCILTISIAIFRVLEEELGFRPGIFAGHSLGEYSALVASGKLAFADAVRLVHRRGKAMQEAVPLGLGAMAAVMGVPEAELARFCKEASTPDSKVEVANYNSPTQQIISGHKGAVDKLTLQLSEMAKVEKLRYKVIPLRVSAPFHSSLMTKARQDMTAPLEETAIVKNDSKIIANITGEIAQDYSADYLIKQIDSPVLWTKSLHAAQSAGFSRFLEVGPGKVLQGLIRKTLETAQVMSTDPLALPEIKALF